MTSGLFGALFISQLHSVLNETVYGWIYDKRNTITRKCILLKKPSWIYMMQ